MPEPTQASTPSRLLDSAESSELATQIFLVAAPKLCQYASTCLDEHRFWRTLLTAMSGAAAGGIGHAALIEILQGAIRSAKKHQALQATDQTCAKSQTH